MPTVILFPGHTVDVSDFTLEIGGSFWPHGNAVEQENLEWAYNVLKGTSKPFLFDIGASSGAFTLLARYIYNLKVYAFEPVKRSFGCLLENINLNRLSPTWLDENFPVTLFPVAVGDYVGTATLNEVRDTSQIALSIVNGKPAEHKAVVTSEVPIVTVDEIVERYAVVPTFLKIDVEGGEWRVIRGAMETIERYHPTILCEYSPENMNQYTGENPGMIADYLRSVGYNVRVNEPNLYAEWSE